MILWGRDSMWPWFQWLHEAVIPWFCAWPWFPWFHEAMIPWGLASLRLWFHDSLPLWLRTWPWFHEALIPCRPCFCTCLYCWVGLRSSRSLVLYHSLQSLIWDLIGTFPGSWVENVMKGNRCDGVENIKCWDEQDAQYFEGAFCISSTNTGLSVQPHKVPLSAGQAPVVAKLRETFI